VRDLQPRNLPQMQPSSWHQLLYLNLSLPIP
jgi:hypothetical protein